jgi:diguanylate cyclase (GGDEF)-like protein/PAS domain S-box-containing protein
LTDRAQHEEELWEERRKLSTLMNNLPGLVYVAGVDAPWPITFISEGAETMTGYAARDFTDGRLAWADLVHPDDVKDLEAAVSEAREKQSLFSVVYRILTRTGEVRWILERGQFVYDLSGEVVSIEGLAIDVTSQKEAEERMRWVAHHDALTRLPNRVLFNEQLDEAVRMSSTANQAVGLLFLDVDHLKHVNDTLGHDAGDALLQTVAYRLQQAVAGLGIVSRIGGDEFAIVLSCLGSELELYTTIDRILESLGKPFLFSGRTVDCRASIGASVWLRHGSGAADLLKQADMALQAAKTSGRAKAMLYEPGMRAEAQRRASMLNFARRAVDEGRIEPFYQPKVLLGTGELAGFEALLRYRNRDGGILLPSTVQAAFDHPHFAVAMGQQMQERVIGDMRRWLDAGINFGHVAVNASAAEFRTGEFAEQMLERLKRASVPTSYLELEVTETVFLGRGAEYVEQALRTLHAEGVRIALDDFGTGYASLLHLKRYPVDIIKIDQSFVRDLTRKSEDAAILSSVLALGRSLSMTTVAEGIETAAQAEFLHAYGCDLGQGYLFARPDPGISVPDLVSSWSLQLYPTPNDKTKES